MKPAFSHGLGRFATKPLDVRSSTVLFRRWLALGAPPVAA
jgi:hypothetical protein